MVPIPYTFCHLVWENSCRYYLLSSFNHYITLISLRHDITSPLKNCRVLNCSFLFESQKILLEIMLQYLNILSSLPSRIAVQKTQNQIPNFLFPVHLLDYSILLQIFFRDCVNKQIFYLYFVYSPSLPNFSPSVSMNFNQNIKQLCCVKVPNLMVLLEHYFAYLI